MPIRGLTDKKAKQDTRSGRTVSLGTIGKGERTGFGKDIKLYDRDYFVFKPAGGDKYLAELFEEAYGSKPAVIPDVRIPVGLAGNFDIEDCAWLTASRHTEKGSIFMARSDGENIKQARNPETGRVEYHYDSEMPHEAHTEPDKRGNPGFRYMNNVYTWTKSFAIDLILPDFNRICFENEASGLGTVALLTHSIYDITNLIGEYNAILDELVGLFTNPFKDDPERVRAYLPLRDFPLRLYRSTDKITTPDFRKDALAGARLNSTRSLLHWQLNPALSAGIQLAIDQRTSNLISAVGQAPQLAPPDEDANDLLFGKVEHADPPPRQIAAPAEVKPDPDEYQGPDWEDIAESEDVVFEDAEEEPVDEPVDEPEDKIIEGNVDELDPQVEDSRNWLTEKFDHGKVSMTLVANSLVMTGLYRDVDAVKDMITHAPEFEEMRAMGLTSNLNKKYTAAGGLKIFDIAVGVAVDSLSEEEE